MEVSIKIESDSDNSYPKDKLVLTEYDGMIYLQITGSNRRIGVVKHDLKRALKVLAE